MNELSLLDIPCEPERYELYESSPTWDWDRREFFRIAGAGLVVALLFRETADAQRPAQGRQRGGGRVCPGRSAPGCTSAKTASSPSIPARSKSARTSAPPSPRWWPRSFACPSRAFHGHGGHRARRRIDGGTSGSGTTPRIAPQLARAAAAARELLLDLAAEQGKGRPRLSRRGRRQGDAPTPGGRFPLAN